MNKQRLIPDVGPLEYRLLRVLWRESPLTARDVMEELNRRYRRDLKYTTIMTLLTRLVEKGLLEVDRDRQPFQFRPAVSRENLVGQRQPMRVIIDTNLSTPLSARLLKEPGQTVIMTANSDQDLQDTLREAGAEVMQIGNDAQAIDLHAVLEKLAELKINEVLLETGATLSGAMLEAQLIDEMVIYMAPLLMGDNARGLYRLPHLQQMADRIELDIRDVRPVGKDLRITATPIYKV